MALAVATIELRLMGEPALLVDGAAVSFAGFPRLPAMLAYLALAEGPVRREQAAFALWPDDMESAARANLRRSLHRLQTLLGESGALDVSATSLALRRDRVTCDVWELEGALQAAPFTGDALSHALQIYRGGLLPALEDEWLTPLRDGLRSRLITAIDACLRQAAGANDPAAAQRYARALLSIDPFREEALRALMNALAQSGDRSGALAEYRTFEARLRGEFEVDPDAETTALYQALAKGATARRTHNLPFETDPFIGRESELEQIEKAYETRRAVTICGAPGVGKSRLALHYAHGLRKRGRETWHVQLAPVRDRREMADALLAVLRIPQQPREEPFDALCRGLAETDALLYLDTAEHIVADAGGFIEDLLEQCAGVQALVTSREPLKISAEAGVRIEPLPLAQAKDLLVDRAIAAGGARVALDDATLESLCRRLECIPLALEIAAARASAFPLAEIERALERDRSSLRSRRHKTLEETIAWSYGLLDDFERSCLHALSVFEETWTLDAASAVCRGERLAIADAVASLVDKSFVHCVEARSGRRYALYRSVRDFAEGKSDARESERARDAFIAFFRDLAETLAPDLSGARQALALDILRDERSNIGATLREADASQAPWGAPFALALYRYWLTRGSYADALHWMERFADIAPDASARARCCADAAVLATLLGDVKRAQASLECATALDDVDDAAAAEVHHASGVMAHERGDLQTARAEFLRSLEYARRAKDDAKIARALDNIGTEHTLFEDFESARASLEESLAIYRRLGGVESVGWVLYHLAGLAFERGDFEGALALNAESLDIRRTLEHTYGIALCYGGMGQAKFALARYDEAERDYIEALRLWRGGDQRSSTALALESLAAIAAQQRRYRRAGLLSQAAQRLRAELGIEMRPHERHLHDGYQAAALTERDAFETGQREALMLTEKECVDYALAPPS